MESAPTNAERRPTWYELATYEPAKSSTIAPATSTQILIRATATGFNGASQSAREKRPDAGSFDLALGHEVLRGAVHNTAGTTNHAGKTSSGGRERRRKALGV